MKKSVVSLFALISFLCFSIISCDVEIGLGSSVDTKAPELTIENPPAGSVIRDVFAITGTCSDDGVIESITVDLKQTNNPVLSYTLEGTFNQKEGIWSCEVNPLNKKTPIPDGSYEVAVTITDTAKRETIRTRSYTIDNTAPVLAITRPSSVIPTGTDPKKYSNSDSFGQDFVIEGHVADTCERRFISVDVYDMDSKLVYSTLNVEDEASRLIKIDSDFSTTIASFGDEAYTAIYGDDEDAGAKMFFCEITVYDSAKKYPLDGTEPAGENQLGNSVEYFYMYEGELYNTIFDAYGMTNAYKILNGSFTSDDSRTLNATVSPADVKKDLENTAYQETRGFLSLNPKNNPYFKVSGHEALNKDDESKEEMKNGVIFDNTEHHITNNSNIVVEVYPGLDQTPLIQDNLGLYLLPADVNGKQVENAEKIWLIRPLVDKDGNAIITDTTEIAERNELISKIGSTYKFTVYISTKKPTPEEKNLYSGQRYIFGVQGWDKKGIEVKNAEAVYGFKLVESGTAPALTIKNVTPNWITTNENTPENPDLVDENAVKNISVTLAFAGDAPFRLTRIVNETEEVELLKSSDEYRETEYPDSYTPPAGSASGTIRYILTSNNDLTSTESTEYYVDNIRPEVVDYAVPSVKETEKPSYKFTGEVSDENATASSKIAEVQMKLSSAADDGSIIKSSKWISVGNTNKWDYTVVFQEDDDLKEIFAVEGAKNIEVRAIDNAGNISEIQKGLFIFDTGSPKLTVQNYKMGNNAVQTIKDEFFAKESFTISGTVSDEYEMKSLSIKQIKGEGNNAEELVIPVEIDEKGNWTVENLPRNTEAGKTNEAFVDTGIYSYIITATDKADKQTNSATYKVTIDLDSPVVEITSPAKDRNTVLSENYGNALSGENFGFSGTMKDNGTGVKDYSYKFVKDNETPDDIAWIPGDRAGDSWNIYTKSAVLTEGLWSLLIKAIDNAGNESAVAERKFVIDQSIPSLEAEITENANCKKSGTVWYYKENLSGKIKEADDSFGLDEALPFTFSIGNVDVTSAVEIDENRNWLIDSSLFNFDSSSLENSEKTLFITVHDKVGKTNSTSFTVYKDTSVPQISITYPAENDPISDSQFTARGSITDGTGIGVGSLEYKVNQDDSWHAITSGITSTTWTQNFNFEDEPEGKITLSVRAKDMLGNESEPKSVTFFYDKQNPQVSIDENDDYYINGTTYTLSGTAYDTNRLSYVTIQDNTVVYSSKDENAGITLNGVETALSAETAANWSKTFTTGSNGILKDGLHTIKVYAYDTSNRKSTELTKELFVDTTAPTVISVDTPSAQETEESYYQFSGETRDSAAANAVSANAASGVDKVYVKFTDKTDTTKTTGWIEASGTTRWTLLVNYADDTYSTAFGTEGEKTISVKAVDKAGNESAVSAADFIFDKAKPAATVSSYTVGNDTRILGGTLQFDVSDSFSLTGTASDSYKLKKIQIIQRKNDEEDKIVAEITSSESSLNWTVSDLPRAENSLGNVTGTADTETDATYKYAVKVFDASGEAGKIFQTSLLSVRIDKTAPVVEITAPSADLGMAQALSGQSYTFKGNVNDSGVGLEKYQYAFTTTSAAPAKWETVTTSESGIWQIEKALVEGTQTSSLGLNEGKWYFWFKASDTAGNESASICRSFYVDRSYPVLNSQITAGNACIEQSGIYYFNGSLSGTVTASDTNALDKIEFKLGETVINPTLNNGTWTIPATAFTESTLTTLTITAYDVVGKTTVNTYQVYNDTTAPSVKVAESALKENDSISHFPLALYGTFSDGLGIGADVIYYSLDGTDPTNELSVSGSSWTKEIADTGFAEGNLTLKLKIKDKLNNISETTQIPFYYDISDPSLTETGIGSAGATVHSNITLQGTVGDTNDLAFVEITDSGNTDSTWTINKADMTASSTEGVWNWSQPIQLGTETNKLADGNHTLTIIAEDIAGKQTKITRSIVVDNTVPVIAITKPATDIDKHYSKNSSYTFEGTASDNLGIKSLEAKLYKKVTGTDESGVALPIELVNSADLSVNAGNWKWSVYELDNSSSYYATFDVKDIADNLATVTSKDIVTDFTAPESTLKVQKDGSAAITVQNNTTTTSNVAYTLSGTVTDSNFNSDCIATVRVDNAETTDELTFAQNTTNWTYTGIAEEGEHTYIFKFSDLAGNENSYTLKVRYDTQAPEVLSITSPESDDATGASAISGSSKKFTGNAEDNGSGLASYSYIFAQTATPPDAGWTSVNAENGAWEISRTVIATTTPSSDCLHEGEWYLFVKATDKAGNTSTTPAMRHFWVDQSAPALTNVNIAGGTYYFNTDALTISGKAIDTNALDENSAVVIKKTSVGSENTDVVLATISAADVAADGSWSANIDESAIPSDGTAVTITIEATDIVGKSSGMNTYTVCKDMVAPVVTASPVSNAAMAYQKSVNYTFSGTATDTNMEEVTAVLYRNGVPTTEETSLSPKGATGAWEWKVYDLEEAYYSIKITAKDKAGNETHYQTGSVMVDTTAPETTVNGTALYDETGTALSTGTEPATLSDGNTIEIEKKYAQSSYTLSGTVTDANFEYNTQSLVLKENGTEKTVTFIGQGTDASPYTGWSYTPESFTEGTEVTDNYTVTVTDKAGNKTTYSLTVVYDTKAPVLTINSPVNNSAHGNMPPVNGKATDNGIGIKEVKWSNDNSADDSEWSEISWTTLTDWSAELTAMENEGPVTLYVKAKDNFGRTSNASVNFSYDLYNPEVTETDTVQEYQKAGYNFTLTGTAGDTNGLDCVTITEGAVGYGSTNASDKTGTARILTENAAVTLSELSAGTALTAASGKGKNWSISFSDQNQENPQSALSLSEGSHKLSITAKDTAGKVSTEIIKNIFIDITKPTVLSVNTPTTLQTANASFRFEGTAKDDTNAAKDSRVKNVQVGFKSYASAGADESTAQTEWLDANGDTSWNFLAVFTDESLNSVFGNHEGYKTICVRAYDYAGNESTVFESPKFLYDRTIPTSVINSYTPENGSAVSLTSTPSFFANNTFKLNLTANDGYLVKKIVVKQKNNGITKTVYESDNINLKTTTVDVLNLPRNVSGLDDDDDDATETSALTLDENSSGEYEYSVEVTDVAGKTAEVAKVVAKIDRKVPTITLGTELNAAYYQGLSKTFSFSASDPTAADGSSGSGLSKYYYKFTQDTATQTASSSGWTEKVASSSFDVIPSLVSGNTLGTNGELNEGQWYLWYYVKDNAGNTSTPTSASFWLDQGAPTLNAVITPAENSIVGSGTEFYFNSGLSGTISASDSSNVAPALSYKIDNGTAVSVTGTSWSIPASSFTDEGAYSLVFTATDQVGRTATKEFTVHKDISAPTLSITSPTAGSYFEQAAINIRGNVRDNKLDEDGETEISGSGVGVNKIFYSTDNSTWTELTAYSAGGAIWNDTVSLNKQGNVTLYVKAVDKLGQESDHESVTFSYDAAAPVIVETVSVAANQKQGYSFTLEGIAYDTNELSYVEIVDKIGDTVQGTYKVDNDDDTTDTISIIGENTIANAKSEDTAITWRKTFSASDTTPLAQGQHTFYISAKDTSQRLAATITKDVFIDTVKPVLTITTPDAYTNSEYVTFNGTITEANLSTLVVKLYKQGDATEKATVNLTPQGNGTEKTWSYTAHLADNNASYYITVLATDRVDNTEEASTQSHLIKTDRTAPATTLGASGVTNSNAGTVNAISENVTYYAKADYTISGTITETNYDKDKVTITAKKNDVAVTDEELTTLQDSLADSLTSETDKEWSFTGITGTGSYEYKLQIEDLAGNKSIYTILIVYDDTPPTVTHNTVSSIVNTTAYEFSGTITDTNYYNATVVLYKDEDATDATSTIEVDADNNWAWRPTGLEDGIYYAVITAKDKAGNTNSAANGTTGSVIVDRTRPTTSLNGSNLTDSSFNTATTLENEGTYYASSEYTISGTISDVNWGTGATAKYKLDGGTETDLTVNSTTKAWSLPSAKAGHTYEIKLKDSAANENTYTVTVSYDATAPNATIVIPEADITNPQYALSANNYSFKLSASDNTGGVGVKELSYIFTDTDSLSDIEDDDWQTDSNFTTADKFVVMNLVPLNTVDSNSQPVVNTLTATQIPEGAWYLWVKAKDKAGNVTPDATITANRRKIIVDKSNPTLTVTNSLNETGTNPIYGDVTDSGYTVSGTISDTNALAVTDESEDENDRVYAIEIKVEGVTATTIASSALEGTDGTVWSYTIPKASIHENGLTEIEIIAKDIVGKTTSKKYTVYYDINDPELEVTAPVNDEQIGNGSDGKANKIIKGTIRDEGYGLAKLEFKLKNSSGSIVKDSSNKDISGYWSNIASDETNNYPIKIKGEQWFYAGQPDENGVTGNTALTIPLGTNEGTLYLEVTATEIGASNLPETSPVTRPESFERNGITTQTVTFFYDASEPNITESGSVSRITNTDFVLIGTAYDTNQLAKIEIKQGGVLKATTEDDPEDGVVTISFANGPDSTAEDYNGSYTLASAKADSTKGYWEATFPASSYADGSYQFSITATDISGKMTTVTRTIQMDKTPPANISPSVTTSGTELSSKNWYNSRAIAISVTATDTNGSGVSSADYTLDGPSAQDRSWTNIPNNGEAFVGTVNLPADGENTFYVRVKDVAGNYGYNDTGVKVYIDSAAPASATVASVDGVAAGDGEGEFGGTKLTNGSSDIAFTMTAADSGTVGTNATGIDSIKIIKVGNNTLEGNAQIDVTEDEDTHELGAEILSTSITTSGGVIARVTDKVGNSYDFTLFQIQYDNKYPTVTMGIIADADTSDTGENAKTQINGITTISGTASDDQTLASVKLQYSRKTGATTWSDWADTGLTNQGTIYSWSFKVDTTQSPYSDGDTVRFRVLATDAAGNEGNSGSTASAITASNYKEVVISQDTDRPVIKINNLEMTNPVDTNYYWLKYDTMYGTVSDDDGTVESVKYKVHRAVEIETEPTDDQGNSTWETVSQNYYTSFTCEDNEVATGSFAAGTYYTKSAWSSNVYNNGMWEISSLGDGQTWIYFEVKDAEQRTAEKVFTSNANSTTPASYGPKIKDSTGTAKLGYSNTQNDILKVKVDTAAPEIISEKYYLSDSAAYDAGTAWGDKNNIGVLSTTKCGGKDKFLYIRVETRDSNGINTGRTAIKFNNTAATTTADGDTPNPVRIIQQNPSGSTVVTIVRIDLSQFSSGTNNFAIDLYDNAGKSTKDTKSILIDNTAPELMVSNYTAGVMLYGSNNNSFRLYQNGDSDISKFYFYVTDNSDFAPVYNSASNTYTGFTEMDDQKVGTTTTVFFDGGTTSAVEYHAPKFYNIIQALTGKSDDQMLASDDPVPLWFWFYAVDDLGNASVPSAETRFAFNVFPNGDKPRIDITYPARKQADQNAPVSVGGTIRVTGYTEISTDTVDAVYIQIDPTYDYSDSDNLDGDAFNEAGWKAELETAISGKNVSYSIVDLRGENLYGTDIPADSPYRYAIKASGTVNWSFNLNSRQEVNTNDNHVAIRAFAVSSTNHKISEPVTHVVKIDANAPLIGNTKPLELVKYENADGTGNIVARQVYVTDMYLKGKWYLEGSIEHESGIKTATWSYSDFEENTWVAKSDNIVDENTITSGKVAINSISSSTSYKNYNFKLPVGFDGDDCGTLNYTLVITDGRSNGAQSVEEKIRINYDNRPPILHITSSSTNSSIVLTENETGNEVSNTINQSNGTFTIEGNVNESGVGQSGFNRVAMFYTREVGNSGTVNLVDPMLDSEQSGIANYEPVTNLTYSSIDNGGDGLYWRTAEGTLENNEITLTTIGGVEIASVTNFAKIIRNGGLCKINDVIYRISNVNVTTKKITVEGSIENITTSTTMYFAAGALIIDHKSAEGGAAYTDDNGNTQYYTTSTYNPAGPINDLEKLKLIDDDGDQMIESAIRNGTAYNWSASINSSNIHDGIVTVHFVAFDNAGNVTHKSFKAKVANNAPRIAGAVYGTDSNGNNVLDESEKIYSYHLVNTKDENYGDRRNYGNGYKIKTKQTSLDIGSNSDYLVVKGALTVIPEIVGGNDGLGYTYEYTTTSTSTPTYQKPLTKYTGVGNGNDTDIRTDDLSMAIPLTEFLNAGHKVKEGEVQTVKFVIWDYTEGTTPGSNSGSATINLFTKFSLDDGIPPENVIKRFHWVNTADNSVYYENGVAKGHIELENDWINAPGYAANATSGEYDGDPKVSGIIILNGVATDETCVEQLSVYIAGDTGSINGGEEIVFAKRDRNGESSTRGQFINTNAVAGIQLQSVEDTFDNTKGKNTVKWKVKVDTSKLSTVAESDVVIRAGAYDRGSPSLSNGIVVYPETGNPFEPAESLNSTGTGIESSPLTALYRVDIVPYISKVETKLSQSLKSSIKNAYSRTALGHYIVSVYPRADENENVTIEGFNLGNSTYKPSYNNNEFTVTNGRIELPAIQIVGSGPLSLTVNGVETLNNKNNNNACGSYKTATTGITEESSYSLKSTYAYNRMPNGTSNNLLTDDVVFDVWQLYSDAAKPRSGELREPSMKINPVTGKVGVAFVSGPGDFAMAGGFNNAADADANADPSKDIYSYNLWQNNYATFNNVSFTYDSLGYAHATATGLDTNPSSGSLHAGRFSYFYNRWGRSGTDTTGNYNGSNAVRLESLAVPIPVNSDKTTTVPWMKYILNYEPSYTRYLNGDTFTESVDYLLLKGAIPETDSLTETRFYSPSLAATVHGTDDSATTAVYLAYYDSLQGQIRFRYTHEIPNSWDSTLTYENLIVDTTENTWSVDPNSTYKDEYLTGTVPTLKDGIIQLNGFNNLHHSNNDTDDFVDNLGYFRKSGDWEAYMEANTDHFSLIAGVDYQVNADRNKDKAEMQTEYISSRNVNVDKVDAEGNAYDESFVTYRKGKIDTKTNKIVTDGNDKYNFKNVDGKKYLYKNNTKLYEVSGEGDNTVLINVDPTNANNGKEIYKVCMNDTYADNTKNYGYPIFDRVLDESGNPIDSGAAVYLIPTVATQSVPIIRQKRYPTGYDTGYTAYKYVAIDARTPDTSAGETNDVVVAVWFDGTNCRYAYNTNPSSGLDNGTAGGWAGNKIIFSEGGEYCTVKFDPNGGVHIAAYVDGSLRYAYLSSYNADYNEETDSVRVDSYTITGERINLDVGLEKVGDTENYVVVPYITYFNGTARKPTVAKLVIPESGVMNYKAQGTNNDDIFTGNWEISLVPSLSTLTTNYYDKMNIALWKWEGKVVNSNDDRFGTAVSSKTSANNTSSGTNGNIYGNGTSNPILGYAVESTAGTYLETAQMK